MCASFRCRLPSVDTIPLGKRPINVTFHQGCQFVDAIARHHKSGVGQSEGAKHTGQSEPGRWEDVNPSLPRARRFGAFWIALFLSMLDPLSIAATSAALVGTCGRLVGFVYQFAQKVTTVDTALGMLSIELEELRRVLAAVHTTFSNPELARAAFEPQTGHEGQHWANVKRSMSDCETCLCTLERLLEKVSKEDSGLVGRGKKILKMSWKDEYISLHKQQISAYRHTMELSLQLITVYMPRTVALY